MIYRVTYPLITTDAARDFARREDAERFAAERRNLASPYLTIHSWRRVRVVELELEAATEVP
jgi:hypothetical protein